MKEVLNKKNVVEENRLAWDEVASIHKALNWKELTSQISNKDYSFLDTPLIKQLMNLGVAGKTVAQFNCNNGRELISAKRLGALSCVGFDYSFEFIKQAQELAELAQVDCQFVHSNIYDISPNFDLKFDIVFVTAGALCWMPDLVDYFAVVNRVLKPGGCIILHETHPVLEMFEPDRERTDDEKPTLKYSYFNSLPTKLTSGLDYYSNSKYDAKSNYWYHHRLCDIFMACIVNHLSIEYFEEFSFDNSIGYREMEKFSIRPPMSMVLIGRLQGYHSKLADKRPWSMSKENFIDTNFMS